MTYEEFLRLLEYIPVTDIHERQALLREYCYFNNIDLARIINC